jgi:hypothetical protein
VRKLDASAKPPATEPNPANNKETLYYETKGQTSSRLINHTEATNTTTTTTTTKRDVREKKRDPQFTRPEVYNDNVSTERE